ncbi:MAG TPA: T9SS type A sorting domain-containing protein [bacterium]|jgi:hypothetical protein
MLRKTLMLFAALAVLGLGLLSTANAVMLNEILYDTQGTDDVNLMFTELWGTPGTDIGGWTLVGINGNGGAEYVTITIPDGTTIPADGYFVIGNTSSVSNVDYVCGGAGGAGVDWQNAGSTSQIDCDGIDLRDADGATVDHLCYGECRVAGSCTGEGSHNAPDYNPPSTGPNKSLARMPDHQDTGDNAADWTVNETLTPGAPNAGVPCVPQYVTLSQVRANDAEGIPTLDSSFVVFRGIVNIDNYLIDSTSLTKFFIQDDDAGVQIFRGGVPENIVAGDCLTVSGWVGFYRGLTEIISGGSGSCVYRIDRTNHVNPPTPSLITCASPFEQYEGMVVRINNVHIVSGTWPSEGQYSNNLIISDDQGTIELSINKWTNVDGSPQPTGAFSVVGIISQYDVATPYDGYYEIIPRSTDDIITLGADDPHGMATVGEFRLDMPYPNPFNGTALIHYTVGSARDLTLTIYDVLGREVLHERLSGVTPGEHSYSWTPTAASGLYLLRLTGASQTQTAKLLYLR